MSTTYYVDGYAGNDSNSGISETKAWASLHKVNTFEHFNPGDSVLFKGGAEHSPETKAVGEREEGQLLVPPTSGESGKPITFGSYGGGKAVLKVGRQGYSNVYLILKSWLVFEDIIFEAKEWNEAGPFPTPSENGNCAAIETTTEAGGCQHIVVRNCEFNWVWRLCRVYVTKDENWTIEGCVVNQTGMSCIDSAPVPASSTFPTGWVIENNNFKDFAQTQIGEAATHGIYGRLKGAKVKSNIWEPSKYCNGACISQRGSGWEIVNNTLKTNENGTPYGFFPYQEELGTTVFAYNRVIATIGTHEFAWYCQSEKNSEVTAEIAESFTICNNTFYCPHSKAIINPKFINAAGTGNSTHIGSIKLIIVNNIVAGGTTTEYPLAVQVSAAGKFSKYTENYNLFSTAGGQKYYIETTKYETYKAFHEHAAGANDKNEEPGFHVGEPIFSLSRGGSEVAAGTHTVEGVTYKAGEGGQPFEYSGTNPDLGASQYFKVPIIIGEPAGAVAIARSVLRIPTLPTGVENGDLLVMMVVYPVETATLEVPEGWTERGAKVTGEASKRATFTREFKGELGSLGAVEGTEGYYVVYVSVIRGWNTTTPVNGTGGWRLDAKALEFKLPSVTASESNCLALGLISSSGSESAGPESWIKRKGGISGSVGTAVFSYKIPVKETGEPTFTQTVEEVPAVTTVVVAPT